MLSHGLFKRIAALSFALALLFGLAACGDDDSDASADTQTSETTESEDQATDEDSADDEDSGETGEKPDWAKDVTTPGDKLTTIELDDVTVDVYQVDVTEASEPGRYKDPDTDELLIDKGDDIVYVNYVVTNHGDPIQLGSSLVNVTARYDDWKYMQSMSGINDRDQFEEMDVNKRGIDETNDPAVYTLDTDETYSFGANFMYKKGTGIKFEAEYNPVDDNGDRVDDGKVEGEAETEIK